MITSSDLVARDGYVEVFYELADLLDIPAQSLSPMQVWEEQMLPRILALEADKAALVEAANNVLEWWPEPTEETSRQGRAKGDAFAQDIRDLRAALAKAKDA